MKIKYSLITIATFVFGVIAFILYIGILAGFIKQKMLPYAIGCLGFHLFFNGLRFYKKKKGIISILTALLGILCLFVMFITKSSFR